MPLDATPGGANSNSYLTVAAADAILAERVGADDWSDVATEDKEKALISATRRLDQERYRGSKINSNQALAWPRIGTFDQDDLLYASDVIPLPVRLACADLALVLIQNPDLLSDTGLESFDTLSIGDKTLSPSGRRAGTLPTHVARYLRGLRIGGDGTVRLVRG